MYNYDLFSWLKAEMTLLHDTDRNGDTPMQEIEVTKVDQVEMFVIYILEIDVWHMFKCVCSCFLGNNH